MEIEHTKKLSECNRIGQEFSNIYRNYAASQGVAETVLWILYSVYLGKGNTTQGAICEDWCIPAQTVNSSLKKMERDGFLTLTKIEQNRRRKQIALTEKGAELAKKLILPLVKAENDAFSAMSDEEQELLFSLTQKQLKLLKLEVEKIES